MSVMATRLFQTRTGSPSVECTNMKLAVVPLLLVLSASCASTHNQVIDGVPGQIVVVAETDSPYWRSWINLYIPRGLNDYARYQIATASGDASYKLAIRLVNADSRPSGFSAYQYGATINYQTMVEVEAVFLDPGNRSVWSWSGWANSGSGAQSMKRIAKMLGKAMADAGLLAPSYYKSVLPPPKEPKEFGGHTEFGAHAYAFHFLPTGPSTCGTGRASESARAPSF